MEDLHREVQGTLRLSTSWQQEAKDKAEHLATAQKAAEETKMQFAQLKAETKYLKEQLATMTERVRAHQLN
jgi:hypothetical protein